MPEQITLEQVLGLVGFKKASNDTWKVLTVYGDVHGDVHGDVGGDVWGDVGDVDGDVRGTVNGSVRQNVLRNVNGKVLGKINGRRWESVETPQEKLERLIQESGDQELIEAFNQLQEDNSLPFGYCFFLVNETHD